MRNLKTNNDFIIFRFDFLQTSPIIERRKVVQNSILLTAAVLQVVQISLHKTARVPTVLSFLTFRIIEANRVATTAGVMFLVFWGEF